MRRTPWTICLWPGLPQLWSHGSWSGLALAIGAAGVLNALLLVSFGWCELIGPGERIALWGGFAAAWIVAAAWSIRCRRRQAAAGDIEPENDTFGQALDHYLRGDYYEAEQILEGLLRRNDRDLEARLMSATLLRHVGRLDEALQQLDLLACFEGADKWALEIENERERLTEAQAARSTAA